MTTCLLTRTHKILQMALLHINPRLVASVLSPFPRLRIPSFPSLPSRSAMYSAHSRPPNDPDSFLFELDEQCKQSTVFDSTIFADWLIEDPAAHNTSPTQQISIPFHPPIVPPSPSVASSSSLGSPQSTSLSTSPPTYNPVQQEFFDTPQYSGSADDVSSYDNQFLAAYHHSYLQPPVWAANLWDNSTGSLIIPSEQFPMQTTVNTTIDPSFVHSRESSPNDVYDSPPSPLFINPHNFSTSPTLAAAENASQSTVSATRPQPYPIGRRRAQADHVAFLSTSAPSAITPLSYHRSPRLSRSYTRRAQSVTSDESVGDPDATIRKLPKRSQQSHDESRTSPDKSLNETPSCVSPSICPTYARITDLSLTQHRTSLCSDHRSWPPPHGSSTLQISFRGLRPTPPRSSTSHRQPRRPARSTQTSAPLRKRSGPYLISISPIFNRGSLHPEIQAYVTGCQRRQGEGTCGLHAHSHSRRYQAGERLPDRPTQGRQIQES